MLTSSVDKFEEAKYFLDGMLSNYHNPVAFRYNLNAFLQALRNITFMLQSEEEKPPGFEKWYGGKQEDMRHNPLLRNFVSARNLIVKRQALEAKSKCMIGVFRGRTMKVAIGGEVPPLVDTYEYLERAKESMTGNFMDEEHSAIGEQLGVERTWVVEAIGPDEVSGHCAKALVALGAVVREAKALAGEEFDPELHLPDMKRVTVLLESDVDPSLPDKWGW